MPGPTADMRKRKTALRKRTTLFWLGRPDLNRRMEESKSSALPLGDGPEKEKTVRDGPTRSLVGCLERFELSASRATIWRANQLRHRHHEMRPKGLEPLAHCLEGSCSIHLSYGRTWFVPIGACCEGYYNKEPGASQGVLQVFLTFFQNRGGKSSTK